MPTTIRTKEFLDASIVYREKWPSVKSFLEARLSEGKYSLAEVPRDVLSGLLPKGYEIGFSVRGNDSFFDALAQAANFFERKGKGFQGIYGGHDSDQIPHVDASGVVGGIRSVNSFRSACRLYAEGLEEYPWLRAVLKEAGKTQEDYIREVKAGQTPSDPKIDGRILCEKLQCRRISITQISKNETGDFKHVESLIEGNNKESSLETLRLISFEGYFLPVLPDESLISLYRVIDKISVQCRIVHDALKDSSDKDEAQSWLQDNLDNLNFLLEKMDHLNIGHDDYKQIFSSILKQKEAQEAPIHTLMVEYANVENQRRRNPNKAKVRAHYINHTTSLLETVSTNGAYHLLDKPVSDENPIPWRDKIAADKDMYKREYPNDSRNSGLDKAIENFGKQKETSDEEKKEYRKLLQESEKKRIEYQKLNFLEKIWAQLRDGGSGFLQNAWRDCKEIARDLKNIGSAILSFGRGAITFFRDPNYRAQVLESIKNSLSKLGQLSTWKGVGQSIVAWFKRMASNVVYFVSHPRELLSSTWQLVQQLGHYIYQNPVSFFITVAAIVGVSVGAHFLLPLMIPAAAAASETIVALRVASHLTVTASSVGSLALVRRSAPSNAGSASHENDQAKQSAADTPENGSADDDGKTASSSLSEDQEPAVQKSVDQKKPVDQQPVDQKPAGQSLVGQKSTDQAPVNQEPAIERQDIDAFSVDSFPLDEMPAGASAGPVAPNDVNDLFGDFALDELPASSQAKLIEGLGVEIRLTEERLGQLNVAVDERVANISRLSAAQQKLREDFSALRQNITSFFGGRRAGNESDEEQELLREERPTMN